MKANPYINPILSRFIYLAFGSAIFLASLSCEAANKNESTLAGKQLYTTGVRSSGVDLTSYVGRASIAMSASNLPCISCHGRNGKGKPEGGVKPSNLTWYQLSKPGGGTSNSGRKFKRYDEDSFLRAVTAGIDSSGNKFDSSMPRYNLSRHDVRDLINYLKIIENENDPGITDNEIVFSTIQPGYGWQRKIGEAITSTIEAYFKDINKQGGIYGRKLVLKNIIYNDADDFSKQVKKTTEADKTFALVASISGNADQVLTDQVEKTKIISVAPYTNHLTAKGTEHTYTFYLYGGLGTQINALIKKSNSKDIKNQLFVILHRKNSPYKEYAKRSLTDLKAQGMSNVSRIEYQLKNNNWVKKLTKYKKQNTKILFLGSTSDLLVIASMLSKKINIDRIYMPGMFVSGKILMLPNEIADKILLSYHTIPAEDKKLEDFYHFLYRHKFGKSAMSVRLFAYSAASIAIEGLKRAGRRVSREKVITALESLYDFDAGFGSPVSFGSSRRIGVKGAYMVKLDKKNNSLKPVGNFVALD